jgi:hypothetical protein
MRNVSTTWIRFSLVLLFLIFACSSIVVAGVSEKVADNKDNEWLNDRDSCDRSPHQIISVLDLKQFDVDSTITESTPYWIFIVAGKNDKNQLLKLIKNFDLPEKQTSEWKRVLKNVWEEYPLKLDGDVIVLDLHQKKGKQGILLTKEEKRILGDLDAKMAEMMDLSGEKKVEGIGVQWASPTHQSITYLASIQEGVPDHYAQIADENSVKPDEVGFPIQQVTHYFNPDLLTGLAPMGCQMYADNALNYYRNRRWNDAFTEFGYSSHFLADVGNPMHTGAELQQGITDLLQLKIHSSYEDFIKNNWQNMFQSYVDNSGYAIITSSPFHSTTQLAAYSHKYLTELNAHIYWNWVWNGGKLNLNNDARIISITGDCLTTTTRYMRGLVRYLTINGPVYFVITPSAGPHGSISPSYPVDVVYDGAKTFTITPDSGYVIDQILVNGVSKEATTSYPFTYVQSDQTITATFKPASTPPPQGIVPLCPAGIPFDSSKYPQNTAQSNPMEFACSWDGMGRVFISGDKSSLTGIYADDGYTITIQPSGASFDAPEHWAHQHPVVELTSGMRPGVNSFTLVVQNWMKLSMSYGSSTGIGTDQTPYILQVTSPAASASMAKISTDEIPFIQNETLEDTNRATSG